MADVSAVVNVAPLSMRISGLELAAYLTIAIAVPALIFVFLLPLDGARRRAVTGEYEYPDETWGSRACKSLEFGVPLLLYLFDAASDIAVLREYIDGARELQCQPGLSSIYFWAAQGGILVVSVSAVSAWMYSLFVMAFARSVAWYVSGQSLKGQFQIPEGDVTRAFPYADRARSAAGRRRFMTTLDTCPTKCLLTNSFYATDDGICLPYAASTPAAQLCCSCCLLPCCGPNGMICVPCCREDKEMILRPVGCVAQLCFDVPKVYKSDAREKVPLLHARPNGAAVWGTYAILALNVAFIVHMVAHSADLQDARQSRPCLSSNMPSPTLWFMVAVCILFMLWYVYEITECLGVKWMCRDIWQGLIKLFSRLAVWNWVSSASNVRQRCLAITLYLLAPALLAVLAIGAALGVGLFLTAPLLFVAYMFSLTLCLGNGDIAHEVLLSLGYLRGFSARQTKRIRRVYAVIHAFEVLPMTAIQVYVIVELLQRGQSVSALEIVSLATSAWLVVGSFLGTLIYGMSLGEYLRMWLRPEQPV